MLDELVFVGGSVTGLLITDDAAGEPRSTLDVDAIVEITSYAQYTVFGERLRALGFTEDTSEGAPVCRWVQRRTLLDVMPLDEGVFGFANRWHRAAMKTSVRPQLTEGLEVRMIAAPFFVATKLEAFKGRGKGEVFSSAEIEDIVAVVDGRATIVAEIQKQTAELRTYRINALLMAGLLDALPGYLSPDEASQSRITTVLRRLEELASPS